MVIILEPGHQDANRPGGGSPAPWGRPRVSAPLPPGAPGLTRHHRPGSACIAEAQETEGLSLGSRPGRGLATALRRVPCGLVTSLLPQRPPRKPSPGSTTCHNKTLQFPFLFKAEEHEHSAKPERSHEQTEPAASPPLGSAGDAGPGNLRSARVLRSLGFLRSPQLFTHEGKVNDTEKPSVHVRFVGTVPSAGFPAPLPGALLGEALPFFPFPDHFPSRPFVPLCRLRAHCPEPPRPSRLPPLSSDCPSAPSLTQLLPARPLTGQSLPRVSQISRPVPSRKRRRLLMAGGALVGDFLPEAGGDPPSLHLCHPFTHGWRSSAEPQSTLIQLAPPMGVGHGAVSS